MWETSQQMCGTALWIKGLWDKKSVFYRLVPSRVKRHKIVIKINPWIYGLRVEGTKVLIGVHLGLLLGIGHPWRFDDSWNDCYFTISPLQTRHKPAQSGTMMEKAYLLIRRNSAKKQNEDDNLWAKSRSPLWNRDYKVYIKPASIHWKASIPVDWVHLENIMYNRVFHLLNI